MRGRRVSLIWRHDPTIYAPAKYRRACRYEAYIPEPLSTLRLALDAESSGLVSDAENAIRDLNATNKPSLAPLARLLLRTESIASSKVEGMQVGVRALARAEAYGDAGRKVAPTARQILANVDAMQLAIDEGATAKKFIAAHITSVHRRLMGESPGAATAGHVRTRQNWLGGNDHNPCGADFVPPPPEHIAALLSDLCDAVNEEVLPPLVQAALVHAQFETIHPFDDGNGRTGRALIHVILRRRRLAPEYVPPISVVLAASRQRYIGSLTQYRDDEVAEWIQHFAIATAQAAHLATGYVRAVERLTERWRAQLADVVAPRADAAAWAIIAVLPAHSIISAPIAIAATSRARAAVYQGISELERAQVLKPLSSARRNQLWEAIGLLDLVAGLEAGRAPPKRLRVPKILTTSFPEILATLK
ncbi:MAG: Fic family protein [Gemmatimonadaceae bacterium]